MTFEYRRVSLNTTLKNARIFDDDSWNSEDFDLRKIKNEPDDNDDTNQSWCSNDLPAIKTEPSERSPLDEDTASPIKQERLDFETKLKFEPDDPIPTDNSIPLNNCDGIKESPQSTGRRVILKRKNDLYSRRASEMIDEESTPKKRLLSTSSVNSSPENKKFKSSTNKQKKKDVEKDAAILQRRQKQIDYGKNTIGYDKYIEVLPKHKRNHGDPQTPDKYRKYSRRGWDGLIKQWRLKLHNYDPVDVVIEKSTEESE